MNCLVRTIERCYTYLKENTMYKKSITITTQSGWWTQVYRRTITSPHRVILFINIISVLNGVLCRMTGNNTRIVVFLSCEKPVNTPFYLDTSTWNENGEYSSNSSISHSKRYKYVTIGTISAKDVRDSCKVEMLVMTSWPGNDNPIISCTEVHNKLVYGFELSWIRFFFFVKVNAEEGTVATLITWTLSNATAARLVGKYSEKGHNPFHSLIKYLTSWPLSSSRNIVLLAIRRNFLVMLLKFNRFNFKVPNSDVILFFVKNAGLGEKLYIFFWGEVSISKK